MSAAVAAVVGCGGEGTAPRALATHPAIGLDRSTVEWTAPWGIRPAAQTVAITNAGDGALTGVTVAAPRYPEGQPSGWLEVQGTGTTAPMSVTLRPTSATLSPGRYTATIPVLTSAVAATVSQREIAVTLTVSPPALAVDSTSVNLAVCLCNGSLGWYNSWRSLQLTERNGLPLSGLRVLGITDAAGVTAPWLTATLSDTVAPATLRISVPFSGVPYPAIGTTGTAYVEVGSSIAGVAGSPTRIAVKLAMSGPIKGLRIEDLDVARLHTGTPLPPFTVYACEFYKGYCSGKIPFTGSITLQLLELHADGSTDATDRLVGQLSAPYAPVTLGATSDNVIVSRAGSYLLLSIGPGSVQTGASFTVAP